MNMSEFNICVNCTKVEVEYATDRTKVEVSLDGVDFDDVITEIGEQKALSHFSADVIRDYVNYNGIDLT